MNRTALITGGASGMGLACARLFAARGYNVAVAGPSASANVEAVRSLELGRHLAVELDVSDENSVADAFDDVERSLGSVSVIANFAGILGSFGPERAAIEALSIEEWERIFAVNSRGSFLCVREMLRRRRVSAVESGRIILISSSAAQTGTRTGTAAYGASKAAVFGLVKTAALEAAPLGITVNAIAPGSIDTPMLDQGMTPDLKERFKALVPLGRIGRPEEVAAATLFLSSPEASYITGACLDVNGGLRMQ